MFGKKDLSTTDVSERAVGELEYVLSKKDAVTDESTISVEEAMAQQPVYQVETSRDVTRILFISTDTDLLNPISQTLDGYVEISDLFDEVHILVMRTGLPPKNPILRASDNVWIYTVSAKYWWQLPDAGMKMIEDQLVFASGFRPDLIVARDPIESAWLAVRVVQKYTRPVQLHIVDDFTSAKFRKRKSVNFFRRLIPYFTIGKFKSIRTLTNKMTDMIADRFNPPDVETLPRLQNYDSLMSAVVHERLADRYRGLSIFLLYIGDLSHNSQVPAVLEATKFILRNKRIGLIIIGEGPAKSTLQRQAKQLGVETQIIFERAQVPILPYLKGSHILIVPDVDSRSEEVVLQGAAAGIPLLIAASEKRHDIFVDKYSAYFMDPARVETITNGISDLLNDVEGRALMAKNAQVSIKEKFLFDGSEYATAYRQSIEKVLFLEGDVEDDIR